MLLLSANMFVFLAFCTYLLALLAVGDMFCSLATFVFIVYCTSYDKSISISFSLICLLAFVHFVVGLSILAFF